MNTKKQVRVMKAPDMFTPEVNQVFDVKTGQRISYGHLEIIFEPEQEVKSINQLELF